MQTQVLKITAARARDTLREVGVRMEKGVWLSIRDIWGCCQARGIATGTRSHMAFGTKVNAAFQGKGEPGELKTIDPNGLRLTRRVSPYLRSEGQMIKECRFEQPAAPSHSCLNTTIGSVLAARRAGR